MKWMKRLLSVAFLLSFLTGCMFPQEELAKNQAPNEEQVAAVQSAVERFKSDNGGILPIKTKDAETPIYQKYLIDFQKLVPKYLSEVPGNSYESGGVFQYVLVDVETEPAVKIFDLRIAEEIREIKLRIGMQDYPPFKEQLSGSVFSLDFKKMGYESDPFAYSPYSGENLPFVITGEGELYVDYRTDIYRLVEEGVEMKPGTDVRESLVEHSIFVPAYSLPYTLDSDSGDPIFLEK